MFKFVLLLVHHWIVNLWHLLLLFLLQTIPDSSTHDNTSVCVCVLSHVFVFVTFSFHFMCVSILLQAQQQQPKSGHPGSGVVGSGSRSKGPVVAVPTGAYAAAASSTGPTPDHHHHRDERPSPDPSSSATTSHHTPGTSHSWVTSVVMGCFGRSASGKSDAEESKRRKEANKKINQQIQKDKQVYRATHRLLLLGSIKASSSLFLVDPPTIKVHACTQTRHTM